MFDGIMTALPVDAAKAEQLSATVLERTGVFNVKFVDKPIPPHNFSDLGVCERNCEQVAEHVFRSYSQVKEKFEEHYLKLVKPSSYFQVLPLSKDSPTDPITYLSEDKLVKAERNRYYYTVTVSTRSDSDSDDDDDDDETDDGCNSNRKRKRTNKKRKQNKQKQNYEIDIQKHKFVQEWVADENIKTFMLMDCTPLEVPEHTYNGWNGFAADDYDDPTDEERQEMRDHILPFIQDVICNRADDSYTYVMNYTAQMAQDPGHKTRTALVLLGKEGAGKNTWTDFLTSVFGPRYRIQASTLADRAIGRFAAPAEGARLIFILDEIKPKDMNDNYRAMMDLITSATQTVERKGVSGTYEVTNLLRLLFSSNDAESFVAVTIDDRKFAFIEVSDEKVGKVKEFFEPLRAVMAKQGVRKAFLEHLRTIDYSAFNFETDRPKSKMYIDSQRMSVPWETRFISTDLLEDHNRYRQDLLTQDVLNRFETFVARTTTGKCSGYSTTVQKMGIKLGKIPGFLKDTRHGDNGRWSVDLPPLCAHLMKLNLLVQTQVDWLLHHTEKHSVYSQYLEDLKQGADICQFLIPTKWTEFYCSILHRMPS